ncbi:MAG: methylmalonyl-CoA epimerase [Crocinitomicaceae bacterium]|jgi:methylmalonyl-CoA/ethylmalonyl-CoA epimerase|tara:strand:+ start:42464 stop:42868 length:405 start_codon:yes stop_codon:yes gene_type:complete
MIKKIEHLGIAVSSIDASLPIFEKLLGKKMYKSEVVESEHVKTAFIALGDSKIELVEATNQASPIAKFLNKNKEGFHHLALDVEDIEYEISRLKKEGFTLIHESPKDGADNKRIAFLHPKSTNGMLIELCEEVH